MLEEMNSYKDFTRKDHSKIFPGSIRTYSCSPTENCSKCGGSGRCQSCAGSGYTNCRVCRGSGACYDCGGKGIVQCGHCHGRGEDNFGHQCLNCYGRGYVQCTHCHGKGLCNSCNGSGQDRCTSCSGTGSCFDCRGSGQITCSRCRGTGFIQTYLKYVAHYYVRQYCNPGPTPELLEGLRLAHGYELCNVVAKSWKKADILQYDDTVRSFNQAVVASGNYSGYAEEFKKEYARIPDMQYNIDGYKPYMNIVKTSRIPCTRVRYIINDKEYEMVFVGTNGVVCYQELPTRVKAFDISENDRQNLEQTAYERHEALAILTAYLYNLDKSNKSAHDYLDLLLKHMCMDAVTRHKKINSLLNRYNNTIDTDGIISKIVCLLSSKKTICYAWQIIAVSKEPSSEELNFFNRLVSRYGISESEINNLKRFASSFAKLDDEQFIKEYLDSPPVYRDPNYKIRQYAIKFLTIVAIISLIAALAGSSWIIFIISVSLIGYLLYKRPQPLSQKEIDRLYGRILKENKVRKSLR